MSPRRLRLLLRLLALVVGVVNTGAAIAAESMGEDGINYLDQGDAWMRGDWGTAVNGTWSPLYPLILGLVMRLGRPSMTMEFPLVHVVNFGVFVLALACFEFFWRQVTARYYAEVPVESHRPDRFPPWAFLVMGYGLFIWTTTSLIRLFAVTPDMLVAAFVFLGGGLMLRLLAGDPGRGMAAALGAALGAGYLAKAVMFPLGIVALLVTGIALVRYGRPLRALLPAVVAFAIVAGPFLVALSVEAGRFTFSDVGRTSWLRHVLGAPYPHYESGSPHVEGEPLHPIARSSTTPPVYRFDGASGTTYPLAYDQGYWYAGLGARFHPVLQLQVIALNLQRYFELFFRVQGAMVGIGLVLLVLIARGQQQPSEPVAWPLALVGLSAFAVYSLVYVEGRYVAPFLVLLWAALLLSVRLRQADGHGAWLHATGLAFSIALGMNIVAFHLDGFNALARIAPVARAGPVSRTARPSARPSAVASALHAQGLQRGDSIGVIGEAIAATWARLARLRIVADVNPEDVDDFWDGSADQQRAVLDYFAAAGVRAVVAHAPEESALPPGWLAVGNTGWLVWFTAPGEGSPAVPALIRR